jgi:hypothetical protein
MNSIARTVRQHMPELRKWYVPLDGTAPRTVRLITAVAVYRLGDHATLARFLGERAPVASYQHVTERYGGVMRVHYFHKVDLYVARGALILERLTIPRSHRALIVGVGPEWTYDQVLATATWDVVG